MELGTAIATRRSVRKFTSKKPDWRDILECLDSMRYAPMAGNIYTLRFIVVNDEKKIQEIAKACQQDFVGTAHYVVVVCSKSDQPKVAYGEVGEKYARQQAGAAIQNFLLSIQEKGLATCWVGHFAENQIKDILRIPGNREVEAIFPIGYAMEKPKSKKIEMDRILFFNKYRNKRLTPPEKIEV